MDGSIKGGIEKMKSAPRRAENAVAMILSKHFANIGVDAVERIPVTGRVGPDITLNRLKLVVDVKNRAEVPDGIFHDTLVEFGDFLAVPLDKFGTIFSEPVEIFFKSKIVSGYYLHMKEWTDAHEPDGIACVILHKSGAALSTKRRARMPFGKSMLVISKSDLGRLQERWKQQ
jgi:hypothetical protein